MEKDRPNVVPIGGFHLPAPPDWRINDETEHLKKVQAGILGPDDLTIRGRPRCTSDSTVTGVRCGNESVKGTTVCRFHGASHGHHPDDTANSEGPGTAGRQARIDRVRTQMEYAAMGAVLAVQGILEDDEARPQDRLKAAEIVLDRTIGRTLQIEAQDAQERDLDQEILQIAATFEKTG